MNAQENVVSLIEAIMRSNGNTWMPKAIVEDYLRKKGIDLTLLRTLQVNNKLVACKNNDGIVLYTIPSFSDKEDLIAINAVRLLISKSKDYLMLAAIDTFINEAEAFFKSKLDPHQREAVKMVCLNNLSVLTGGPGTGKTFVLKVINYVLRKFNKSMQIVFTAPTGKAARRITESTNEPAQTLHSKIKILNEANTPTIFKEDVMFCDESSMLDLFSGSALFRSIPNGRKTVLVGDIDQLPSVGPGAILRDFIACGCIPVTMLTKTFRQDNSSVLYENIVKIREGNCNLTEGKDFHLINVDNYEISKVISLIASLYEEKIQQYGIENVILLTPYRKCGETCSNSMNGLLQKIANGKLQSYYQYCGIQFKKGDYVMQLKNRDECANGDVGQIIELSRNGLVVKYVDCTVGYNHNDLEQLVLAYAMSIHKSQGSEYPCVITTLLPENKGSLQRNLIYTAVTRAKLECNLIYTSNELKTAIENEASCKRVTMLSEKIIEIYNQYKLQEVI